MDTYQAQMYGGQWSKKGFHKDGFMGTFDSLMMWYLRVSFLFTLIGIILCIVGIGSIFSLASEGYKAPRTVGAKHSILK